MEINVLYSNNLRNEEHSMFHIDFTKLVTQYTPAALGIELKYPAYQAAFGVETQALNVVRASELTDELLDAESERDNTFSGMAGTVKSAMNHFDPEVRVAANRLKVLFDTYGNLTTKPNDQETASIIKLVSELRGNYLADATKLSLTGWINELERKNNTFNSLKGSRYDENASKPQQNLKMARQETDKTYKAIVKRINALIEVNGDTAYAGFVTAVNERIENYQHVLAQRQGRNAKDNESDDSGGGEAEPKK
jgi:hypothetical protein